jgi:hypothetical protein
MLEIIVLIALSRRIYENADNKGLPGWPFVLLFLGLWLGCEFVGILIGILVAHPGDISAICGIYFLAFMGATFGGLMAFVVVAAWPEWKAPRPEKDLLDPNEFFKKKKPRRKKQRRPVEDEDDYEDDPPPRRPRGRDDDRGDTRFRSRRDN